MTMDETRSKRCPTTDSLTLSEFSSFSEGEPLPDTPLGTEPTEIDPAVSISRKTEEKKLGSKKTKRKKKTGGAKGNQVKDAANLQSTADSSPEMVRAEIELNLQHRSKRSKEPKRRRLKVKKKKGDSKKKKYYLENTL